MIRWIMHGSCFVVLLVIAQVAAAQEFSADVANTKDNGELKKLYAGKNKVRFEVETGNAGMGPTAVILDETQNRYIVVMSARQMYMDAPLRIVKPLITHYWRVEDVNDACPEWKKTAEQAGTDKNWGSCTKVGSETLNGQSTVKYEAVSNKGEKTHVWVATKLRCVVKTDESSGGFELRNIQEGSQPSSLFEVPAGYTKFDMGGMMQKR
ncbi:MAG: hypothetical protein WB660_23515 [Candidatus Sulfotelmatobacter sp.]